MGEQLGQHLQILTGSCRRCLEAEDELAWRNLSMAVALFKVETEAAHSAEVHQLAASARLRAAFLALRLQSGDFKPSAPEAKVIREATEGLLRCLVEIQEAIGQEPW